MKATRKRGDFSGTIGSLLDREKYEKARAMLERELAKDPSNHWLLTQIGVTFYEQRAYQEALRWFNRSREVLDDCPLTRWNLAGVLDALGRHAEAIRIYADLLESKVSPRADPCWESDEWSDSLKADCVYRLGICFRNQRKKKAAEHCFRQYLNLLAMGVNGTYSSQDTVEKLRELVGGSTNGSSPSQRLHKAVRSALRSFALALDAR